MSKKSVYLGSELTHPRDKPYTKKFSLHDDKEEKKKIPATSNLGKRSSRVPAQGPKDFQRMLGHRMQRRGALAGDIMPSESELVIKNQTHTGELVQRSNGDYLYYSLQRSDNSPFLLNNELRYTEQPNGADQREALANAQEK